MVSIRSIFPLSSSRSSILGLALLAGTLLGASALTACSTLARNGVEDTEKAPLLANNAISPAINTAIKADVEASPATPNLLLEGLSPMDIEHIQAEAKRMYGKHWERVSERSRYVRARILPILKDMHAPQQLEVVPVAESGYNPYAFSPVGATGLWQVMPGTARVLGMKAAKGYDARRHVESSTRGGVQYLLNMRAMFGNWPVALAAYHRGPGNMKKRLRRHPWKPADGLDHLPVPLVTRTYVRGILGLSALVGRGIWKFPKPWETHQVAFEGPIDVNQLATAADIDRNEIYRFNPGLNHSQYSNNKVFLHVPEFMLQALLANAGEATPEYVSAKVRRGDSLWLLARRYHSSVLDLKRINPGLKAILHPGQILLVPAGHLNSASPPLNPLLAQGRRIHYRVRSGDNLWNIAKRFGTTPAAIARANSIRQHKILHPGDRLWLLARARAS